LEIEFRMIYIRKNRTIKFLGIEKLNLKSAFWQFICAKTGIFQREALKLTVKAPDPGVFEKLKIR